MEPNKLINSENKKKFFALYWGQEIFEWRYPENSIREGVLESEPPLKDYINSLFINLKLVSDISDEDAIEVAKLMLGNGDKQYLNLMSDFEVIRNDEILKTREPQTIEINFMANLFADKIEKTRLTIYTDIVSFYLGYFRKTHKSLPLHGFLRVIDYLRSKGYALPYMGISVDEMIEFDWIKIKK